MTMLQARLGTRARLCNVLVAVLSLAPFAGVAFGQSADASIIGQVKDETGLILPGVSVTATSPPCRCRRSLSSPTSSVNIDCHRCPSGRMGRLTRCGFLDRETVEHPSDGRLRREAGRGVESRIARGKRDGVRCVACRRRDVD